MWRSKIKVTQSGYISNFQYFFFDATMRELKNWQVLEKVTLWQYPNSEKWTWHITSLCYFYVVTKGARGSMLLLQTSLLDRGIWTKVQGPFPVAVTLHAQPSDSLRIPRSLRAALRLLTYIRVYSRTSVVLLPRFLCFPTRYIIEVAFHPVYPIQPILARTCFYAATRLTLAHYEHSTFIRFLSSDATTLLLHTQMYNVYTEYEYILLSIYSISMAKLIFFRTYKMKSYK